MARGPGNIDRSLRRGSTRRWAFLLTLAATLGCNSPERAQAPDSSAVMVGGGGGAVGGLPGGSGGADVIVPPGTGGSAGEGAPGGTSGGQPVDVAPDVPPVTILAAGATCAKDDDCQSGFCTDKVCCAVRCDGVCKSCAIPGALGTCLPADVGSDPRNDCTDEKPASCGKDGTCDGSGQCRRYPVGTICHPASCVGSTLTASSRCRADGCAAVVGQPCEPYLCNATGGCLTSCKQDGDCAKPNTCVNGKCGKKPLGDRCAGDDECNSKHCAQGVCCGDACTAKCSSCALNGSEGKCTLVPPGQDPQDQCLREDPSSCGLDGTCDGTGSCRTWVQGTICKVAGCTAANQTPASVCDGTGTCDPAAAISCGDYACDTNARCRVSCVKDTDCIAPAICAPGGICGGILAKYFSDITLTNLVLTRTEAVLNNNFGVGSPPGLPVDMFSARYTGTVTPRFSEPYTFYLTADDGVRLWINDAPIIDDWNGHVATEDQATIMLRAGEPAAVKVEYFEKTGEASISLAWSSPSEPKAIIPTVRLSPRM